MNSGLNNCLTVEANIDQGARFARQDIVSSMLNEGVIAVIPIETDLDPRNTGGYDILTYRVGRIVQWYPQDVRVEAYNDRTGRREEIVVNKRNVAIIQNPLFAIMNEPNSTVQRLMRKLAQLDAIENQASSGKLDMIIQLPYAIKSEARRGAAEQRRKDLEVQLKDSQYGIGYTDATEKVIQLNRSVDNNMLETVKYLTEMVYSQLGITKAVMDGTAEEKDMLNYIDRTVEPILGAIAEEFKRKFLTKTARTQMQSIEYYRDPFKLVPMSQLAEIADKFTRNEILTSNEFRAFIGMKPSTDPKADKLINSNNIKYGVDGAPEPPTSTAPVVDTTLDDTLAEVEANIDSALSEFGLDDETT
jgi:hypothetical protein